MNHITYDYYRIFYYVAKYKSISQAAKILHSNQPNITKFMNKLEEQLGCKLMIRSNRGITLTPEGERLFAHVSVAYAQLKEAEEEIAGYSSMHAGTVRISATETALHGILLDALIKYRKSFPGIHLFITNESTPEAIQTLRKGAADLAIVTSPVAIPSGLRKTSLGTFREILVAAKDSPLSEKAILKPADIRKYSVIGLGRHSKTYELYSRLFLPYGVEWQPDIDVATADQILPMVKAGLGIGFLPEFMAKQELELKNIVSINVPGIQPEREIVILEDSDKTLNVAARELKKYLMTESEV
ncbi:MAG: LysR family transcriptional regulator [Butyribacter sp.]|nr:LysR family transcriptional regulator [bacterium]MDY3855087.1 LysR family transcriptional regulator [Butyribacter sp.]